ncbi:MAG: hypothetical protein DRJ03_02720 [Chloroflexi bacterium]|nr:MAG: hypothetical protein DRJ03_02720 [Chloroflexota bacterium]
MRTIILAIIILLLTATAQATSLTVDEIISDKTEAKYFLMGPKINATTGDYTPPILAATDSLYAIAFDNIGDGMYFSIGNPYDYATGDITIQVVLLQTDTSTTSRESRWELSYNCGYVGDVVGTDTEDGTLDSGDIVQPNTRWDTYDYTFTLPIADIQYNMGCGMVLSRQAINDGTEAVNPALIWIVQHYTGWTVNQN